MNLRDWEAVRVKHRARRRGEGDCRANGKKYRLNGIFSFGLCTATMARAWIADGVTRRGRKDWQFGANLSAFSGEMLEPPFRISHGPRRSASLAGRFALPRARPHVSDDVTPPGRCHARTRCAPTTAEQVARAERPGTVRNQATSASRFPHPRALAPVARSGRAPNPTPARRAKRQKRRRRLMPQRQLRRPKQRDQRRLSLVNRLLDLLARRSRQRTPAHQSPQITSRNGERLRRRGDVATVLHQLSLNRRKIKLATRNRNRTPTHPSTSSIFCRWRNPCPPQRQLQFPPPRHLEPRQRLQPKRAPCQLRLELLNPLSRA